MAEKCPHGLEIGWSELEGIAWAGGVGLCRCHGGHFGYIASGTVRHGSDPKSEQHLPDTELCPECGGKVKHLQNGVEVPAGTPSNFWTSPGAGEEET